MVVQAKKETNSFSMSRNQLVQTGDIEEAEEF